MSESFKQAVINGLRGAGISVLDIGLTGTEEIYFVTKQLGVAGGIEIILLDYNKIKFVLAGSKPTTRSNGLGEVRLLAEEQSFPPVSPELRGGDHKISILNDYVDHLLGYVEVGNIAPLKFVVNAGSGAAGHVSDAIEERFNLNNVPIEFIKVHHEPDGSFLNGIRCMTF